MFLSEVQTFLAARPELNLVATTNLFHSFLPTSPDLCVCIYEYPGMQSEPVLGGDAINIEYPGLQILTRGVVSDYDTPRLLMNQIIAALATIGNTNLSGVRYGAILPKGGPYLYERDAQFRVVIGCNFYTMKDWSNA